MLQKSELCACDLMPVLDLPQSTVSRHLSYLRHAGLVKGERQGVWMYYRLAAAWDTLARELLRLLADQLPLLDLARRDRKVTISLRDQIAYKIGVNENT